MTARYFAILTNYGAAQLANAVALGTQMNISAMAVGDGGGTLPVPDPAQTKLVRETRRAAVNQVSIDEKNPNFIIAEQVIPENEGGWFIREIGLFDDNGGLIAVGNAPETYKPNLQEGSGRTQVIQMVLMVNSTQAITLKVDPSVVLATREYVTKSVAAAIQESETKAAKIYATKSELSSGLSGKQPTGDYATRTELNNGLSGKQPTGDYATKNEVSSKLTKNENGADIPDKAAFINNLGLRETINQATGALQKERNGADIPDKDLFVRTAGACRGFSRWIDIGGDSGTWTTEQFISWLENQGAFNHAYWVCKGSWSYARNKVITDTGCGHICLAGSVVEVMGQRSAMTVRVTTPSTSSGGGVTNAQFTYINHGPEYSPGWRRDFNTRNLPPAFALGKTGNTVPDKNAVGWNWNSGVYEARVPGATMMILHFNMDSGSCPAVQFGVNYQNNGISYRSARDHYGFEAPWVPLDAFPVGAPIPWPQATAPSGYLVCNGQSFNKSTYPMLALAYPQGRLPDLRGEFIRGLDGGRGVDTQRQVLSYQRGSVEWHKHISGWGESDNISSPFGRTGSKGYTGSGDTDRDNYLHFTNNGSSFGGGTPNSNGVMGNETRPRNIAFLYIVRAA